MFVGVHPKNDFIFVFGTLKSASRSIKRMATHFTRLPFSSRKNHGIDHLTKGESSKRLRMFYVVLFTSLTLWLVIYFSISVRELCRSETAGV